MKERQDVVKKKETTLQDSTANKITETTCDFEEQRQTQRMPERIIGRMPGSNQGTTYQSEKRKPNHYNNTKGKRKYDKNTHARTGQKIQRGSLRSRNEVQRQEDIKSKRKTY